MSRNEQAVRIGDVADHPLRHASAQARETEPRTIVIRQGSGWQSLAFLCLCLLLLAVVVLGHRALAALEGRSQDTALAMARFERKVHHVESGLAFEARQRQLLLGMRDHILRVNGRVSLGDAYRYAELALRASEKYPAVDPLLLLAIGTVESRFEPQARSHANARGLYQIWPATGRLLLRGLGWDFDEAALYDPEKNTEAAALYLDILFATYGDPEMVLAEYNGGPLNAGYLRAGVAALAAETRNYVPQVLAQYARLKEQFEAGTEIQAELMHRDGRRQAKTLTTAAAAGRPPSASEPRREGSASLPAPPAERAAPGRPAR
ncbi:MAG TPA: lytic transglycosylase domain-containing protein [Vicinamibacteria bacterium]|nr:lytic transglycosylase domain-containing protein [Vicinamibacteria bacterium]